MDLTADGIVDLVVTSACDAGDVGSDFWLVYPGGDLEAYRHFRRRDEIVMGERTGFARLARAEGIMAPERVRLLEERMVSLYRQGKMTGGLFRCPGQVAAVVGAAGEPCCLQGPQLPQRGAGGEVDSARRVGERNAVVAVGAVLGDHFQQRQPAVRGSWLRARRGLRHVAYYGRLFRTMKDTSSSRSPDFQLGSNGVALAEVIAVARRGAVAELSPAARAAMQQSAALVEGFVAGNTPVYGVTTGFDPDIHGVLPGTLRATVATPRSR